MTQRRWADWEDALATPAYGDDEAVEAVARKLGRTVGAVMNRLWMLRAADNPELKAAVVVAWASKHPILIAKDLKCREAVVMHIARQLGLPRGKSPTDAAAAKSAEKRDALPAKPQGFTKAQIQWARRNFNHPKHHPEARMIAAMLL